MDTVLIQNILETLFQDSSRWSHPGRRVVFWYDPNEQFIQIFSELQLKGVEKLQLNDNPFTVKYRLLVEQPTQNFLLYPSFTEPDPQENWLLDIQKSGLTWGAVRPRWGDASRSLCTYCYLPSPKSRKR